MLARNEVSYCLNLIFFLDLLLLTHVGAFDFLYCSAIHHVNMSKLRAYTAFQEYVLEAKASADLSVALASETALPTSLPLAVAIAADVIGKSSDAAVKVKRLFSSFWKRICTAAYVGI